MQFLTFSRQANERLLEDIERNKLLLSNLKNERNYLYDACKAKNILTASNAHEKPQVPVAVGTGVRMISLFNVGIGSSRFNEITRNRQFIFVIKCMCRHFDASCCDEWRKFDW